MAWRACGLGGGRWAAGLAEAITAPARHPPAPPSNPPHQQRQCGEGATVWVLPICKGTLYNYCFLPVSSSAVWLPASLARQPTPDVPKIRRCPKTRDQMND